LENRLLRSPAYFFYIRFLQLLIIDFDANALI